LVWFGLVWFERVFFVLQVKMEKEAQSGAQEELLSVELSAPPAWKKLVSLSLSTYKNMYFFFFFKF
jgi:hypothetical protein